MLKTLKNLKKLKLEVFYFILFDYVFIISPTLNNDKNQFMYRDRSIENDGNFILFDKCYILKIIIIYRFRFYYKNNI